MFEKHKPNGGWYRIQKQVEQSEWEWHEYGIDKIRAKSYKGVIFYGRMWDATPRSNGHIRNWKNQRKTQYKYVEMNYEW